MLAITKNYVLYHICQYYIYPPHMRCLYPGRDGQVTCQSQSDEGTFGKNWDKYSAITDNFIDRIIYIVSWGEQPTRWLRRLAPNLNPC